MYSVSRRAPRIAAVLAVAALAGCNQDATSPATGPAMGSGPAFAVTQTGNGAPSGPHYNLNLIGVPKDKSPDFSGGNGRRIFVGLGKAGAAANTRINLTEGDFAVLDANGTDGTAAFQLPNPDPDGDGTTAYSVYIRALGKPGGKATMQSCYEDLDGTWCAADFMGGVSPIYLERTKGGAPKFTNVSKDLLYVDFCTSWSAGPDTILGTADDVCDNAVPSPLFAEDVSYYWSYDNQGLKLAQLRFYELPTVAWPQ